MEIEISNVIRIKEPTQAVRDWAAHNLALANPEYAKKARLGFWLGNTPAVIRLYETDGDDLILPFGAFDQLSPQLNALYPGLRVHCLPHTCTNVRYDSNVPLYPYQEIAVKTMVDAWYGILQSPAGSGKTQMGLAIIQKYGLKALWLTHTKDLLNQSLDRAKRYFSSDLLGTITEGQVNIGKGITFATIQTMARLDLPRYRNEWDIIVVDECHRVAGSPTAVTQFYKVLNNLYAPFKYGLSATVHRSDGMIAATYALLGQIKHTVPPEAVANHVMTVGILPVETETTIDLSCLNPDGTLNYNKLISHLCADPDRNALIVRRICYQSNRPSLILSSRLEHLHTLMAMLPDGLRQYAVMISGKMTSKKDKAEREQAIEDMRTGKKKYLFATYSLAKEGLDIPCLERLHLATPQTDYAVVTQSIGRVARIEVGKKKPVVYDYVDRIGYLSKCYRKRCSIYKKNGCYFIE